MQTKERIFHMVLFEVIALSLLALLAVLFTGNDPLSMTGLAVSLSLIAMAWNFIYNIGFDHFAGADRIGRSLAKRIGHGAGFELGMIIFSFPVMMWMLKLDFWSVLMLDIGAVVFFFLYAIAFNWAYDVIRHNYGQRA
ncbi:MAG: PACE efflux transporter [Sneathiella sp.]|nr:PACE efflux transporter [Sneathiella sp.]